MKKYLFGLGAMLVGAGLMFVLMHGEVSADDMKELHCEEFEVTGGIMSGLVNYCKVKDLTCVLYIGRGGSCAAS